MAGVVRGVMGIARQAHPFKMQTRTKTQPSAPLHPMTKTEKYLGSAVLTVLIWGPSLYTLSKFPSYYKFDKRPRN